jgi:hypothetical protein
MVSDAIVDIYANTIFVDSVQATDSKIEVNLPKALSLQDKVNPRPVSSSGYIQVKIYSCHTERHTLKV